jgi:hypothetical protein
MDRDLKAFSHDARSEWPSMRPTYSTIAKDSTSHLTNACFTETAASVHLAGIGLARSYISIYRLGSVGTVMQAWSDSVRATSPVERSALPSCRARSL